MVDDEYNRGEERQQPAHSKANNPSDDPGLERALTALLHTLLQLGIGTLLRLLEQPSSFLTILVTHRFNPKLLYNHPTTISSSLYNSN